MVDDVEGESVCQSVDVLLLLAASFSHHIFKVVVFGAFVWPLLVGDHVILIARFGRGFGARPKTGNLPNVRRTINGALHR